jgi:hypothetical protein
MAQKIKMTFAIHQISSKLADSYRINEDFGHDKLDRGSLNTLQTNLKPNQTD